MSDIDTAAMDSLKALDPTGRLEKRTSNIGSECPLLGKQRTWFSQSIMSANDPSGRVA